MILDLLIHAIEDGAAIKPVRFSLPRGMEVEIATIIDNCKGHLWGDGLRISTVSRINQVLSCAYRDKHISKPTYCFAEWDHNNRYVMVFYYQIVGQGERND